MLSRSFPKRSSRKAGGKQVLLECDQSKIITDSAADADQVYVNCRRCATPAYVLPPTFSQVQKAINLALQMCSVGSDICISSALFSQVYFWQTFGRFALWCCDNKLSQIRVLFTLQQTANVV